jgi:cell division protease FtsH
MPNNVSSKKKNNSKDKGFKLPNIFSNIFFYVVMFLVLYIAISSITKYSATTQSVPISDVLADIRGGKVQTITVNGDNISVLLKDGTKLDSAKEDTISFDQILSDNNIDRSKVAGSISVEHSLSWDQILIPILEFGLPILLLYYLFRQMRGANGDIMSFGRSRAKIFDKGQSRITFKDVAGDEEAKREMMEIVDFLKNPQKYRKLPERQKVFYWLDLRVLVKRF